MYQDFVFQFSVGEHFSHCKATRCAWVKHYNSYPSSYKWTGVNIRQYVLITTIASYTSQLDVFDEPCKCVLPSRIWHCFILMDEMRRPVIISNYTQSVYPGLADWKKPAGLNWVNVFMVMESTGEERSPPHWLDLHHSKGCQEAPICCFVCYIRHTLPLCPVVS